MNFRQYIREKYKDEEILEFGPLTRPIFTKKENKSVYYADIRPTEEIKKLYSGNDYMNKTGIKVNIDEIVDIDYIINESYENTFKNKKFQNVYLSHVIEHMPDIIFFFLDISKILKKDSNLIIIYPDKRYCFDHFRISASFRDAYATYKYGKNENARMAFDFGYNVVHENDPYFFWNDNDLTKVISHNTLSNADKYYDKTLKGYQIDDVHYWPFSDIDFLKFIYEAQRADLFPFEITDFYPTSENTQEFMIILKKIKNKNESMKKTVSLISKYDELNMELERRKEIEQLKDALTNKEQIIVKQEKQGRKLYNENQSLKLSKIKSEDEIQNLNLTIKKTEDELQHLKNTNNNLQDELQYLKDTNNNLQNELISVYNSKSMKITKPLRVIVSKCNNKKEV